MNDTRKTKAQLVAELTELRQRVADLETSVVALIRERNMLRTLIDVLPDCIYGKDVEGRFNLSNVTHARLRGVATPEALIGQSDFNFYPHDLAEKFQASEQSIFREGQSLLDYEEPNVDAGGKPRWTSTTKVPLRDEQGRIIGLMGITRDITARKQLEAALRDSEQRYREIFEASPDAIYLLEVLEDGQHFRNLDVNPAFEKMTGTARADLIGKTMEETSSSEVAQAVNAKYRHCVAARTTYEEEVELNLPIGRLIFRSAMVPIQDADGCVRRILGITRDVTQQRQAEQALRDSEERYRRLIDWLPDGVVVHRDALIIFANPTAAELLGLTAPEALIGKNLLAMVHPDSRSQVAEYIRQTSDSKGLVPMNEVKLTRSDGQVIDVEGVACPIEIEGQGVRLIVFRDITARKRAEEALRNSERRERERAAELQTIMDTAPAAIWIAHDQLCQVMTGNRAAYELLHLPPGSNASLTAPAGQRPTTFKLYQDGLELPPTELPVQIAAATGVEIREFECDNVLDDGAVIHMLGNAMPLYDEQGQPRGAVGAFIDITERRRIEIAEHDQRILVETLRDIAATLNSTLNLDEVLDFILTGVERVVPYEAVNLMLIDTQTQTAQIARFHGYAEPEQEQFMQSIRLPLDTTPNLRYIFETGRTLVIRDTHHSDLWLRLPGAEWIESYVGVPVRVKGKVIGFINLDSATAGFYTATHGERLQVFSDQAAVAIENARLYETIRQHAEELEQRVIERTRELREANLRLTELDRLKDEFVSRISHELRTPLTNLKLYLKLLETGKRPDKHVLYIETLKREADRLYQLIEDLLRISELDAEQQTVDPVPIDLNQLATELIATHRTLAARRSLDMTGVLEPDLPRALADTETVRQIMLNLLSNALNYTQRGTVTVSTQRQARPDGMWVTMAVRDTGPGLTAADRDHLFERFYRGHAARDYKTPGVGLGLAISQQLAQKLGGRIVVESEEGQGSTFIVWLPTASN